jgi:NADPH:quinone reductase-like Zn-dependent oxidoreductase
MTDMKALVLDAEARTARLQKIPRPAPASTELLIRVEVIALNAFDPLYIEYPLGSSGRTVGNDFAGTVVEIGSEVPHTTNLRNAYRVAGFLQGPAALTRDRVHSQNIWSSHGKS